MRDNIQSSTAECSGLQNMQKQHHESDEYVVFSVQKKRKRKRRNWYAATELLAKAKKKSSLKFWVWILQKYPCQHQADAFGKFV
jgi:membrane carboxypeptidase/penicillin-binding protein PbpC